MKPISVIQQGLWFGFLSYYTITKFLAGGGEYSHAYALQVGIIVMLTAIVPFYATSRLAASRMAAARPRLRLPMLLTAPTLLSMTGYAAFFVLFIAPNFPDVTAGQVIGRGLLPGVVISALLALPLAFDRLAQRQEVIAS